MTDTKKPSKKTLSELDWCASEAVRFTVVDYGNVINRLAKCAGRIL
jgi:hypothetical protein